MALVVSRGDNGVVRITDISTGVSEEVSFDASAAELGETMLFVPAAETIASHKIGEIAD